MICPLDRFNNNLFKVSVSTVECTYCRIGAEGDGKLEGVWKKTIAGKRHKF